MSFSCFFSSTLSDNVLYFFLKLSSRVLSFTISSPKFFISFSDILAISVINFLSSPFNAVCVKCFLLLALFLTSFSVCTSLSLLSELFILLLFSDISLCPIFSTSELALLSILFTPSATFIVLSSALISFSTSE